MRISVLTIGAIASIIAINSVFGDTTVTSRNYVDAQDALKQDKITAGTTGNVVTYNGTQNGQAQFSERGIFDPVTGYDAENGEVVSGHEGDLVTAGLFVPAIVGPANTVAMYSPGGTISGSVARWVCDADAEANGDCADDDLVTRNVLETATNNLPETTVTYKTCVGWNSEFQTDNNCILWNLSDAKVYGKCNTNNDCPGACNFCRNGTCVTDNENCVS